MSLSISAVLDPTITNDPSTKFETLHCDPYYFTITIIVVAILLLPWCLIQDMQKFKYLGYAVLIVDVTLLINLFALTFVSKSGILSSAMQ